MDQVHICFVLKNLLAMFSIVLFMTPSFQLDTKNIAGKSTDWQLISRIRKQVILLQYALVWAWTIYLLPPATVVLDLKLAFIHCVRGSSKDTITSRLRGLPAMILRIQNQAIAITSNN